MLGKSRVVLVWLLATACGGKSHSDDAPAAGGTTASGGAITTSSGGVLASGGASSGAPASGGTTTSGDGDGDDSCRGIEFNAEPLTTPACAGFEAQVTPLGDCVYELANGLGELAIDPDYVNLFYRDDGRAFLMPFDAECGEEGGWYWDDIQRTHARLCPCACARVAVADEFTFLMGCRSIPPIPK